jgi:hypothetical protein
MTTSTTTPGPQEEQTKQPRTQFVRDRMMERNPRNPEHRQYIRDLLRIEEIHSTQATGWAHAVGRKATCNEHWAESKCISWELHEGRYTDPLSFRRFLKSPANKTITLEYALGIGPNLEDKD